MFSRLMVFALAVVLAFTGTSTAQTLERIAEEGRITFALRDDAPPFAFKDDDARPAGLSVELCRMIAAELVNILDLHEIDMQAVPVTAQTRLDAITSGRADIECGITTITLSRREIVDFSIPFFASGASIAVGPDATAQSVEELEGLRIAVPGETTTEDALKRYLAAHRINAELIRVAKTGDAAAAIKDGRADAMASDRMVLVGLMQDPLGADLRLLRGILSFEPYALVLPRGDADFRLAVDRMLIGFYHDGVLDRLYDKWLTPLGAEPGPTLERMLQLQAVPE